MRIGVISQNVDELKLIPPITDASILSLKPDLYIEMTQEDGRTIDGNPLVEENLLQDYQHLTTVSLNGLQQTQQNIQMNIYIKQGKQYSVITQGHAKISPSETSALLNLQKIAKAFHTGYGYSKGMVYAKIKTPTKSLLFINMHLPVKTAASHGVLENSTLGLSFRRASFFKLLEKLSINGVLEDSPEIFVGGDLNFRMDKSGRNQLNDILGKYNSLKELWQAPGEKRITCKFTRKNNSECRLRKIPNKNVPEFLNNIQEDCGNAMRTPSRCDRFLVNKSAPILVHLNTVKNLIKSSDHNTILCCYDLALKPPLNLKPQTAKN